MIGLITVQLTYSIIGINGYYHRSSFGRFFLLKLPAKFVLNLC
jgi:fatty-acid desaturase